MADLLAFVVAGLVGLWGVAHAFPTRRVVHGFGDISADNRRILVQEWLAEAVTMWTFAALLATVTVVGSGTSVADRTYRVVAGALFVLAALTTFTGARTPVVWFKICPVLLVGSAVLLWIASLV
jgi:hypothetical protein